MHNKTEEVGWLVEWDLMAQSPFRSMLRQEQGEK